MAANVNLFVDQGANFSTNITVFDQNGVAMDLTGYTVRSQLRRSYYSTTAVAFVATIADAAGGIISLVLADEETDLLKYGRYVFDVEIEDGASYVRRVVQGTIFVSPGVTRPIV